MTLESTLLLASLIFTAALLYSSVGHAGASGYLAAMALFGLAPEVMKPTALTLNVLVATIATVKYYRAGCFSWPLFAPFALASVPFAYLGGRITLPGIAYKPLVGAVLVYAAWRFMWQAGRHPPRAIRKAPLIAVLLWGSVLGLLSGLTGVGGGIFLSPLMVFMGWAEIRTVSGVAAAFILVNSIAGLSGLASAGLRLPEALPLWAAAAVIGGFIGAEYGSRRLANATIQRLLALVLAIAGVKMMWVI